MNDSRHTEWILRADHVLTLAEPERIVDGAVRVRDGCIAEVGPYREVRERHPDLPVKGPYSIAGPGLVNAHTHFSEGLLSGMAEDLPIWEWGQALLVPTGCHLTREMAHVGALLKGVELLQSGVTTVNDMFCHTRYGEDVSLGSVDAIEQLGLRAMVCFGAEDRHGPAPKNLEVILREHENLAAHAAASKRCTFALGIGTVLGQSDALLEESVQLARRNGWRIHTHLAEVREEKVMARLQWGRSTVEQAAHTGMLDVPVVAGHGIWLSRSERHLLARQGVAIVHNPQANMILGSGICNLPALFEAGLTVALGTDGAASNDSQNLIEVAKLASLLQKVHHASPEVITAREVYRMATLQGARALGMETVTGSLEPGKAADLVAFSRHSPGTAIVHDPWQQLIYGAGPRDVCDVWVAGEPVLVDGQPVRVDLEAVTRKARQLARQLAAAADIKELSCLE